MRRVKDELSEYYVYQHAHEHDPALTNTCSGLIEFHIKSVTVTLSAQADQMADVNGAATVLIGGPGTLGPSLDVSSETKSASTLKYTFYPVDPGAAAPAFKDADKWVGFPIASSLEQLREGLLKASDTWPCLTFTAPDEPGPSGKKGAPADQSVTFDFNVIRTQKGGATFKFVLFSVGAAASNQRQAGNNVVVVFNATPKSVGLD